MNVKTYLDQFGVLGVDEYMNSDNMCTMLYNLLLHKFRLIYSEEEYEYVLEYQNRVYNLVENLRELTSVTLPVVFDYLENINVYLIDIIIMMWCMPKNDSMSKRSYNKKYMNCIAKYNSKMVKNINHKSVKNFCFDTLSKSNYVPIHCIDYLWFYMDTLTVEFEFYNTDNAHYLGITHPVVEATKDETAKIEPASIILGLNLEYLFEMKLGEVEDSARGTFKNLVKVLVSDSSILKKLLNIPTGQNLRNQLIKLSDTQSDLGTLPKEVVDMLQIV